MLIYLLHSPVALYLALLPTLPLRPFRGQGRMLARGTYGMSKKSSGFAAVCICKLFGMARDRVRC
jgi:hypothetical protein